MSVIEHHGLVLPSGIADRQRLKSALNEVVNSIARVKSEGEQKKAAIQAIADEFDIPKKLIAKVAMTMYNESFQTVFAEADDIETMIEGLQLSSTVHPHVQESADD